MKKGEKKRENHAKEVSDFHAKYGAVPITDEIRRDNDYIAGVYLPIEIGMLNNLIADHKTQQLTFVAVKTGIQVWRKKK